MPITAEEILDNITQFGLEFYRVYPSLYRAVVTQNNDPENRGRIQAHVASIQEEASTAWIKSALMGAGPERGVFWPPEVGDTVYVLFAQGQPSRPECYFGGWFASPNQVSDVPSELKPAGSPDVRGFVTRIGHVLLFSDASGDERVELLWNKANVTDAARTDRSKTAVRPGTATRGGGSASLKFKADGSVEILDNATPNQKITLDSTTKQIVVQDANGNKVTLSATGVKIESVAIDLGGGAVEPAVKGQSWLQWAATHTHPTPMGPSGTPTPPPTPAILSQVVKVK